MSNSYREVTQHVNQAFQRLWVYCLLPVSSAHLKWIAYILFTWGWKVGCGVWHLFAVGQMCKCAHMFGMQIHRLFPRVRKLVQAHAQRDSELHVCAWKVFVPVCIRGGQEQPDGNEKWLLVCCQCHRTALFKMAGVKKSLSLCLVYECVKPFKIRALQNKKKIVSFLCDNPWSFIKKCSYKQKGQLLYQNAQPSVL